MSSSVQATFLIDESCAMSEGGDEDIGVIDKISSIFFGCRMVADYVFVTYYILSLYSRISRMLSPVSPQDSVSSVIFSSLELNRSSRPNEVENQTS